MSTIENNEDKKALPLPQNTAPIEVECIEGVLDIDADFEEFLDEKYSNEATMAYRYSNGVMTEEERKAYEAWWGNFLAQMDAVRGVYHDDYDDDYYDDYGPCYATLDDEDVELPMGEDVWPPVMEGESKKRKNPFNSNVSFKPQRFLNGQEVDEDDAFFDAFGGRRSKAHKRHMSRQVYRHNKKEKKNKKKNSVVEANRRNWSDTAVEGADDYRKIIFYRDILSETDTYEWDNLLEFNEWMQENSIYLRDSDYLYLLNNDEIHCCLDPSCSDKLLVADRSYGDLVWNLTGADEELLKEYSMRHRAMSI